VIAFGASIQGAEAYRRYAEPGVRLAAEPDSEVYAFASVEPLARTYNLILDAAAAREDLEALALLHTHTEITDAGFCAKVREALRDPEVAVVGCAGAAGVRGIAWWEGEVTAAELVQRYEEFGGGQFRPTRGRIATPRRPRWTRSTASCSCSRRGRCATFASTSR
jgi:hypothetical protein